jgi:hypothetical protein
MGVPGKDVYPKGYRGFESLSLRTCVIARTGLDLDVAAAAFLCKENREVVQM